MPMNKLEKIISCMFCGKTKDEVNKLFTSKKANICDDCVKIAFNFKNDDKTNKLVKHHLLRKDFGTKKSLGAEKIADAPIIPKMLNIFEPITLPTAISECPFLTAIIDAAISGKDVPIAIIVRPISVSGTSKI